jgi:transposase-like protein
MMPAHQQASFAHSVDRSDDTKEVSAADRGDHGSERRRKWSAQEKAEIDAESLAEGAVASEVARRHGLSPQQLFGWRGRLRDAVKGDAIVRCTANLRASHRGERAAAPGCIGLASAVVAMYAAVWTRRRCKRLVRAAALAA